MNQWISILTISVFGETRGCLFINKVVFGISFSLCDTSVVFHPIMTKFALFFLHLNEFQLLQMETSQEILLSELHESKEQNELLEFQLLEATESDQNHGEVW